METNPKLTDACMPTHAHIIILKYLNFDPRLH